MTRRQRMTDADVAALKSKRKRYTVADPEMVGHYVRVTPSGAKTFVVVARDPSGKQIWRTVGSPPMPIADARKMALDTIQGIRAQTPDAFGEVAAQWLRRHVDKKELRSADRIHRLIEMHLGDWSRRDIASIKRKDVATMLDRIEDERGAKQADLVLSLVRSIFSWRALRDDTFNSPIVPGMRRYGTKEHARSRILSDEEIRRVWNAADNGFGKLVKLALLTGQRREKILRMQWEDIDGDVWRIPTETREKGNAGLLKLPPLALEVIGDRGEGSVLGHVGSLSAAKIRLDKRCGVVGWRVHDLRRTARSLMSRAGVRPDIAERVLGHAIRGIEGVYDRHRYDEEKAHALKQLASLVERILEGPSDNVVPLHQAIS